MGSAKLLSQVGVPLLDPYFNVPSLVVGLTPEEAELQSAIVKGWKSFSPEVDITAFAKKTRWNPSKILSCAQEASYNHPEVFFIEHSISLSQWCRPDGAPLKIALTGMKYNFDALEYWARRRKLGAVTAEAMSCIKGVAGEVERALRLHDFLASVCDYDFVAKETNDRSCLARTVYSALVRRKAVCEGYAMAYRYLLNAAGIVSDVAVSVSTSHIWNYVRIYGKWYHVDVTYDNTVGVGSPSKGGSVSRRHFLMSDIKARATGHSNWSVRGLPPAKDMRFDGMS